MNFDVFIPRKKRYTKTVAVAAYNQVAEYVIELVADHVDYNAPIAYSCEEVSDPRAIYYFNKGLPDWAIDYFMSNGDLKYSQDKMPDLPALPGQKRMIRDVDCKSTRGAVNWKCLSVDNCKTQAEFDELLSSDGQAVLAVCRKFNYRGDIKWLVLGVPMKTLLACKRQFFIDKGNEIGIDLSFVSKKQDQLEKLLPYNATFTNSGLRPKGL